MNIQTSLDPAQECLASPIAQFLHQTHRALASDTRGALADYIPELADA